MSQFAVMGLGRFGAAAALELTRLGHSVIGADSDVKMVNKIADSIAYAVIADVTDEQALKELNLSSSDIVLVAIGSDLEASILCILHLKNLGVKEIWVKASSRAHSAIASKLGVNRIINPEVEMGVRVAQSMSYPLINQFMPLGKSFYLVDIQVGENLQGRTIGTMLGRQINTIKPVLVRRNKEMYMPLDTDFSLNVGDSLVLATPLSALADLVPEWE